MKNTNTKFIPLPKQDDRKQVSIDVSASLYDTCRQEIKRRNYTIRQVVEWGFKNFLIASNPELAAKLGLHVEELKPKG